MALFALFALTRRTDTRAYLQQTVLHLRAGLVRRVCLPIWCSAELYLQYRYLKVCASVLVAPVIVLRCLAKARVTRTKYHQS